MKEQVIIDQVGKLIQESYYCVPSCGPVCGYSIVDLTQDKDHANGTSKVMFEGSEIIRFEWSGGGADTITDFDEAKVTEMIETLAHIDL